MSKVLVDCPQVRQLDEDPNTRLVNREILNVRLAGDNPLSTAELPVYQSSGVSPAQTGSIHMHNGRPMATQEIHVIARELGSEAPRPPMNPSHLSWHVQINGMDMTPVTWTKLKELVQQGRIQQTTMLRPAGGTTYFEAHTISGLFIHRDSQPSSAPSSTYQVIVDGLQSMPLDIQQLQELIKSGRLSLDGDLICAQTGNRLKVRDCPGVYSVRTQTQPYPVAKPASGKRQAVLNAMPTPVQSGVATEHWLVQIRPTETILVNKQQLKELAQSGRITSDTHVKREDMETFVFAGQPKGLFPG